MDEGHKLTDKKLEKLIRKLDKVYSQAAKETEVKLNDYMRRFKVKDDIKLQQVKSGELDYQEWVNWRIGQIMVGKRWEEMRDTLAEDLTHVDEIATQMVGESMHEVYALNHNFGTFEVEKGSLIDTSYTLYDRHTVERLVKDNPTLLKAPSLNINKDYRWNAQNFQSAITQSILQGEDIRKTAKRVALGTTKKDRNAAVRNARTATTNAENAGRCDSYKRAEKMGIKLKQVWLAALDRRTRDSHRRLDGEKISVGEKFSNGLRFPGDPQGAAHEVWNCRCTLIAEVDGVNYNLADDTQRNSKLGGMSYEEWKAAKTPKQFIVDVQPEQLTIGTAKTVGDVNKYMNGQGWYASGKVDLTGCDIDSAKSIASAYQQVFDKFPNLKGRINAPDAKPVGMNKNTYAWCYTRAGGKVQVNPDVYNNWQKVVDSYNRDVLNGFHPKGTTAESIVTHEVGHAIDGLLAREGVLGGYTKSGEFRYASSSMKTTVMKRAAKIDENIYASLELDRMYKGSCTVSQYVSKYATKNPREWFAECFAEYITSANPRVVAREFGAELEKLIRRLP